METENLTQRKLSLIHVEIKPWVKMLISLILMAVMIGVVYKFKIPNPNMILIAGLVVCSALFGYSGGIVAALIMFGYTLFFFSTDNDFVTFDLMNRKKVVVSLIGIVVDMLFVCELKRQMDHAFADARKLANQLSEDNVYLQEASKIDGLTNIRNRLALHLNSASYFGQKLFVMMLDIDEFKQINDQYGHTAGDAVLEKTGELLAEIFELDNSYRYGGDEFLVIVPNIERAEFEEKIQRLIQNHPRVTVDGILIEAHYSIGYVYETESDSYPLKKMIADADKLMYRDKGTAKSEKG